MDDLLARFSHVPGTRTLSRRDMLRLSAGAGLTAVMLPLLTACGSDDDDDDDDVDATATVGTGTGATTTTGTGGSTTPTAGTGGDATATTGGGAGAAVDVTLADFTVEASPASASAGSLTFNATNDGAMEHELVIIKTDTAPGDLPLNDAGSEADEDAAGEVIGKIEGIPAGETMSDTFELEAGKYVLICNIPGHYPAGMHTAFEVM